MTIELADLKASFDELKQTIKDGIADGYRAIGASQSGAGSAGSGGSGSINLGNAAQDILGVVVAMKGMKDPTTATTTALGSLASQIPNVGGALSDFITGLGKARVDLIKSSQQGIGGGSLTELPAQVARAGTSTDKFREGLTSAGTALDKTAIDAYGTSKNLLTLGENVKNSDLADGPRGLQASNRMLSDEMMRVTMLSQYGRREELESQGAQAQATEAAKRLAKTISDVSQATGRHTTEIESEIEARLRSESVQASMAQMSEKQRESFIEGQAKIAGAGKSIGDLGAKLATGERLDPADIKTMMTLGPAAGEFQRAMRMSAMAQTDDQKAQAARAVEKANADIAAYQASSQYTNVMKNAAPDIKQTFQQVKSENRQGNRIIAGNNATGTTDGINAQRAQQAGIDTRGQGLKQDKTTGDVGVDRGQALARQTADWEIKGQQAIAAYLTALQALDVKIAQQPGILQPFNNLVDNVIAKKGNFHDATLSFSKDIDLLVTKWADADKKVQDILRNGGRGGPPAPAGQGGGRPPPPPSIGGAPPGGSNAEGTKANFGDWFGKDFGDGMLSELHGKEAVVPQNKVSEFIKDMMGKLPKVPDMSKNMPNINDMMSNLPKPADMSKNMPNINDMMTKMQGSVSAINPKATQEALEAKMRGLAESKNEPSESVSDIKKRMDDDTSKTPAQKTPETPSLTSTTDSTSGNITIKDLHNDLQELNKSMKAMVSHSEKISEHGAKTAKYAAKSTGSRALA
jgi:hypothetical protein